MDALLMNIAVQIPAALSMALLVWGGWLALGTIGSGQAADRAQRA